MAESSLTLVQQGNQAEASDQEDDEDDPALLTHPNAFPLQHIPERGQSNSRRAAA
jgi:hypothetical protein